MVRYGLLRHNHSSFQYFLTTLRMSNKYSRTTLGAIISRLVEVDSDMQKLPPLSAVDKVKLEHDRDIEHLYYSSKLEGTLLTGQRLDKAIHG
jgi:hypothetical protein